MGVRPPVRDRRRARRELRARFAYQVGLQRRFAEALPEADQGLGFGLLSSGLMGGQGLGPVAAGALSATLGPAAAIGALGAVAVVAVVTLHGTFRDGGAGADGLSRS